MPHPSKLTTKPANHFGTLVALVIALLVLGLAVLFRPNITDWLALRGYQPSDVVVSLANDDTMTAKARRIFYVNHPEIDSKSVFATKCTAGKGSEKTIVLGCYHGNQNGIFVLEVTDARLTGVEEVTAAHEMLHAAYDRLSTSERNQVNAMLLDYYHHGLKDQRIMTTLNAYKQSEPNDVVNEMHSIFGTEVANLPAPLEQYYKRYFTDRAKVTGFANEYETEFTSRQTAVATYDAQLAALKVQIDTMNAQLKTEYANITAEQNQLNALQSTNPPQYNASVPAYNRLVNDYNNQVTSVQNLVDQYNSIVTTRNAIALEQQQLANDLTNSSAPIQH